MKKIAKGQFIKVNNDIAVVVCLESEKNTPKNHLGIWFGEKDKHDTPILRTIPKEYCKPTFSEIMIH